MSDVQQERPNSNFHKFYDCIFVVVWKEVYRVYLWLYQGGEKYVGDYLETTPRGKKRLGAMEKKALERRDLTSSFDINFLYHLMQHTCGLAEDTSHIWTHPKSPAECKTLEHNLYLLKQQRNTLSHEPKPLMHMSTEELENLLQNLCQLCEFVIQEAGKKANKTDEEISKVVYNMKKDMEDIKTKSTPSEYTKGKFAILAKQEMQNSHQNPSPSSETFVMPLIHNNGEGNRYEMPLKHFALWRCDDGTLPNTVILSGDAGTGKSTICRYLFDSWVHNWEVVNDLTEFDLVIQVQCSSVATRDLVDFLKTSLQHTISLCGRDDTREFLKHLRILWLIDGFEEASIDAKELLKEIQKEGTSSLVFITTKPQIGQDLLNFLNTKEKLCEVSLSGLSEEGTRNMVEMLLEKDGSSTNKLEKFWTDISNLGDDVLKELYNPLKLSLIVKLWSEGRINEESRASLPLLYRELLSVRSKTLSEMLKLKFNISESEIQDIVDKSIQVLCKVAFENSMRNSFGYVDSKLQKQLETGLQKPFLSPADWLSIFLQYEAYDPNEQPRYSFIHNSHQHYLAAQHVCFLIAQKPKPEKTLRKLFRKCKTNPYHLNMMLLQVISNLDHQEILNESVAKILIELISGCSEFDPFDVVHHAPNSSIIPKEVSSFTGQDWIIDDGRVQAAFTLLKFVTPTHIKLYTIRDPKEIKGLSQFLNEISQRNVFLEFSVSYHWKCKTSDSSECYLEPICSQDAKCILEKFEGKLNVDGCELMLRMSSIKEIHLTLESNEILDKILSNLEYLVHLDKVTLIIRLPVIALPKLHRPVKVNSFLVSLQCLDEYHIIETASALSQIHHRYLQININDISADSIVKFIQTFQRNSKVKFLIRMLDGCSKGHFGFYVVNYGSIPLVKPIEDFYDQWINTYLTEFEDELGIKRLGITTKGIPPNEVKRIQILPDFRFVVTDFSGSVSIY